MWLLDLGLIGDEFKNCWKHLLKHLDGNIAWRHPEDAIAQRERLKQARIAAHQQTIALNQNSNVNDDSSFDEDDETESVEMVM